MPGVAVIPTLKEVEAIGKVIAELPTSIVREIIVADSGSTDGTQAAAGAAGARVLELPEPGYGRACAYAVIRADEDCDIIVFMDGDGADRADLLEKLVAPIQYGTQDFVIAARVRLLRESRSMSFHHVASGQILGFVIGLLTGVRYTDMCAFRAIRRDALNGLGMKEMTYGWNIEMQIKAAQYGLRVLEIPLPYRCRVGGESKVAGSIRGTIRASWRIVLTFIRVASSGKSSLRTRKSLIPGGNVMRGGFPAERPRTSEHRLAICGEKSRKSVCGMRGEPGETMFGYVARDQSRVNRPDRRADYPIGFKPGFMQGLIDARLVGAERASCKTKTMRGRASATLSFI